MSQPRKLLGVLALSKVLLALAVFAALHASFNIAQFRHAYANWPPGGEPTLSSRFSTWDIAHYIRLSHEGYQPGSGSCAFYPFWPAAIRLTAPLVGGKPVLAAMLLSNTFSLIGFWLLYRLLDRHCGPAISRDSLILILAFPGALFFSFPYSESIFFVFVMIFFWGLELERWSWTATAGFLLPLIRPTGVFVLAPLAWYFFERQKARLRIPWLESIRATLGRKLPGRLAGAGGQSAEEPARETAAASGTVAFDVKPLKRFSSSPPGSTGLKPGADENERRGWKEQLPESSCEALSETAPPADAAKPRALDYAVRWKAIWKTPAVWLMLCPLIGYAAYFGLMYLWTGNAFEGFDAQKAYPNSPSIKNMFNVVGFTNALLNVHSLDGMMDSILDRAFFVLFLVLLPLIYRLNRTWFFYVLPAGLVPALSSWFMSYRRYVMVLFPMFVVLALLLARTRRRWVFWYYVVLMAALQAWAVNQFINFKWAG